MSNKTIITYVAKYLFHGIATLYIWKLSNWLLMTPSEFAVILGFTLFAGLAVSWVLHLKSDLLKPLTAKKTIKK
jgi:uncharacterized metal-binding protein